MSLKRETPLDIQLHRAAIKGDRDTIVRVLGTGRVHVDCRDSDGTTPLMLAVARCHYNCVEELIEQGADVNSRRFETGATPLFLSAQSGDCDTLKLLIKHGAHVDRSNVDGGTPLFIASQENHLSCVQILLEAGAKVNHAMKDKSTPLFVASQNGHLRVVKLLLESGALVDAKRSDGATSLWICAQMGWTNICQVLLDNGADVDSIRIDGATPLFKACHKNFTELVRLFLKKNPNLGILPNGESCLHGAAMLGHDEIVRMLLKAGADPFLLNLEGDKPCDLAKKNHFDKVANVLKKAMEKRRMERNRIDLIV